MLTESVVLDLPGSMASLLDLLSSYGLDISEEGGNLIENLVTLYCDAYTELETFTHTTLRLLCEDYPYLTTCFKGQHIADTELYTDIEYLLHRIFQVMGCFINMIEINLECSILLCNIRCVTADIIIVSNT